MALEFWRAPADPSVYSWLEPEAEPIERYVTEIRDKTGVRVTPTHVIGKAAALAIRDRPEVNAIIRRGRIYLRDGVDVFFQVAFEAGENLAGAVIRNADQKNVVDIARELADWAERIRSNKDAETQRASELLGRLPPPLLRVALKLGESLTYDFGLDLSRLGIPYDAFGSCMVTSVAGFGIGIANAPLVPPSRVPFVLTVGAIQEKVLAVDGAPAVRRILPIGITFDHRLLDGYQAGKLGDRFMQCLKNPNSEL